MDNNEMSVRDFENPDYKRHGGSGDFVSPQTGKSLERGLEGSVLKFDVESIWDLNHLQSYKRLFSGNARDLTPAERTCVADALEKISLRENAIKETKAKVVAKEDSAKGEPSSKSVTKNGKQSVEKNVKLATPSRQFTRL